MYKKFALFYKKYFIISQTCIIQKLFNCKNFNCFKWAIVLDSIWEKYLVKMM